MPASPRGFKIDQDAHEVQTKFSKSFVTTFFPVGEDIRAVVVDWVKYLRREKLWGLQDPLFPATRIATGADLRFAVAGLDRKHWSSAGPIRQIFKQAWSQNLGHEDVLTTFCSYGSVGSYRQSEIMLSLAQSDR
jgi:hypothetical protein